MRDYQGYIIVGSWYGNKLHDNNGRCRVALVALNYEMTRHISIKCCL